MADAPEPPSLHSLASEPVSTPEPPVLFGRYRVERELGRGGMGRVVLAFDTKLRIQVAVKLVPDQFLADAGAVEDLRTEVLRGMALTHPAIVRTHTFEQDESGAAIVMEYIDGLTFTEWKEQQPGRCFNSGQLLPWLSPLCEVLDYAHREARIVHRDLKPRNIMISQDGRLKVADFGISATLTDSHSRVTGHGPTSGTPAYMSPQQARGKKPSPLDDVYALGATIYDLVAGKPPFFRGGADTILHQLATEPPPTMAERREELGISGKAPIPQVWEKTIAACLAKEAGERPQSCGEVLARLGALEPTPTRAVPVLAKVAALPARQAPAVEPHALVPAKLPIARRSTARTLLRQVVSTSRARHGTWLALAIVVIALGLGGWWLLEKRPALVSNSSNVTSAAPIAPAENNPETATKDAPFVNSLGMKFVPVRGTKVLFSIWDTRVRDYEAYAKAQDAAGRKVDDSWKTQQKDGVPIAREPDHPVVSVSWEDAQAFCQWLTEKETAEGSLPKGQRYQLPQDWEWSIAVGLPQEAGNTPQEKNGKTEDFPWGKDWPPAKAMGNYADETFHAKFPPKKNDKSGKMDNETWLNACTDGCATTSPVGSFPANAHGLYDMGGNVWQWSENTWGDQQSDRVLRGASWEIWDHGFLRSSYRTHNAPGFRSFSYGFRCVLAPSAPKAVTAIAVTPVPSAPVSTPPAAMPVATSPGASKTTGVVSLPGTPRPPTETEKWLAQVEAIYRPRWQSEVVAPYESGLDGLKTTILSALNVQIAAASRAAKLQDALAFRNERQRVESDEGIPPDDSDAPPATLKTLRETWRAQAVRLEADGPSARKPFSPNTTKCSPPTKPRSPSACASMKRSSSSSAATR